jgi:uncharacterized membrane protein YkvA (DUF1232 family)
MTTQSTSIPTTLDQHLSANSRDDVAGVSAYVDRGAALVSADAISALHRLRQPLRKKIAALKESGHLRQRLELLSTYFDEALADGHRGTHAHCETAFALLYFLKGFDRIPDSVPEVGLLDDALIVQCVMQRNTTTLRAHWLRRRRNWPLEA